MGLTFTADFATVCDLHLNYSATNCSKGQVEIFASNEETSMPYSSLWCASSSATHVIVNRRAVLVHH